MATYYIRRPVDADRMTLIKGLVGAYSLVAHQVIEIITQEEDEALVGPILASMAQHMFRPDLVMELLPAEQGPAPQEGSLPGETPGITGSNGKKPRKTRKPMVMELCPVCGKTAQMTRHGYCKLCAMAKARATKRQFSVHKTEATVITEPEGHNPEHFVVRNGAIRGRKLG